MKILLIGSIFRHSSFSGVNINLISSLAKIGVDIKFLWTNRDVSLEDSIKEYCPWKKDEIETFRNILITEEELKDNVFDFAIYFLVDPKYNKKRENVNAKKHIFYTVWSHINFPLEWNDYFRVFDMIFTPSEANSHGLKINGMDSIVIPHGVDETIFNIDNLNNDKNERCQFLMCNSICNFKGADVAINSFMQEFNNDDMVELIIQTTSQKRNEGNTADRHGEYYREYIDILNKYPLKQLHTYYRSQSMNHEDMAKLYKTSNCVLSIHRGDGFGLVPLEAVSCGIPTITTNAHGPQTYLSAFYPYFVKANIDWTSRLSGRHHFPDGGSENEVYMYYEPDIFDVRKKMRMVYEQWKNKTSNPETISKFIYSGFKYSDIAKTIKGVLENAL